MSGGSANLSGSMKTFTQYSEFGNAQFKTSMDAPSVSVSFSVRCVPAFGLPIHRSILRAA